MTPLPDSTLRRSTCRVCQGSDLAAFLHLGNLPLANAFLTAGALAKAEPRFPLELLFCQRCGLVCLRDVVHPELLFKNYPYATGASQPLVEHFQELAGLLAHTLVLPRSLVIDIGSNDGTLLTSLRGRGATVLGIEPARHLAASATRAGVETIPEFFSAALAKRIAERRGQAKVIIASNVFAHIDDVDDVLNGVTALLRPDGVVVIEVHYLNDLVSHGGYDQVYHEHLSYFSLRTLRHLLERFGLTIFDAAFFNIHGKILRAYASHPGAFPVCETVAQALAEESSRGLDDETTFHEFAARVAAHRESLRALLGRLRGENKKIAGYGAPAKGNILLNYCGIGPELLEYLIDTTPAKQGTFTPGTHLPVHPPAHAAANPPDYFLLLAWNYADYILEKEREFRTKGGKFIIPLPTPHIV